MNAYHPVGGFALGIWMATIVFTSCSSRAVVDIPSDGGYGRGGSGGASTGEGGAPVGLQFADALAPARDAAALTPVSACATSSAVAEGLPLDLYLLIDASQSMSLQTKGGGTKWSAVTQAIESFLQQPAAFGLSIGAQFFPLPSPDCDTDDQCESGTCGKIRVCVGSSTSAPRPCITEGPCAGGGRCELAGRCNKTGLPCLNFAELCGGGGGDNRCVRGLGECVPPTGGVIGCTRTFYATPVAPIQPLETARQSVVAALRARRPNGKTPLGPAVATSLEFLQKRLANAPLRRVALVIASDGDPTACAGEAANDAASIAELIKLYQERDAIATYVIGVDGSEGATSNAATSNLEAFATAGATGRPYFADAQDDFSKGFLNALGDIRGKALPCDYTIPKPPSESIDFTRVNVSLATAGQQTLVPFVQDAASCNAREGGWYYARPSTTADPDRIVLCPKSCETARSSGTSKLDILFGCLRVVL